MKFTSHLKRTADDVSEASKHVVSTTQTAHVVLIAVAAIAILAMGIGIIALAEVKK